MSGRTSPSSRKPSAGVAGILLVDEADALAQSRELDQMHHEDRAGVNALIRGIDRLAAERRPVVVVMCTNRVDALDPAIRRRAASILTFSRPTDALRETLLTDAFSDLGQLPTAAAGASRATGEREGRGYGYTFSDLTSRLIPGAVLASFPDRPLTYETIREQAELAPTPPFAEQAT